MMPLHFVALILEIYLVIDILRHAFQCQVIIKFQG